MDLHLSSLYTEFSVRHLLVVCPVSNQIIRIRSNFSICDMRPARISTEGYFFSGWFKILDTCNGHEAHFSIEEG